LHNNKKQLILKQKLSADNYFITDQNGVYFLTFTVTDWVDARLTGRAGFYEKRIQNRDC